MAELEGRTPPGVRGLKQKQTPIAEWKLCRTPPGVRGLKRGLPHLRHRRGRRTPPGVRGLKRFSLCVKIRVLRNVAPRPGCVD